jgi:hypothetical protein
MALRRHSTLLVALKISFLLDMGCGALRSPLVPPRPLHGKIRANTMMEQHVRLVDAAVDVLIDALLNPCGPICIGICGCSGSGKSTLAANLQELMSEGGIRAAVVTQDSYYKTDEDLTPAEQSLKAASALNWDQPAMIKWPLLQAGIDSMRDGAQAMEHVCAAGL